MEEKIKISILLSLYGNLLTETQKKYMDLYYNQDWSLSEIGESESITRQAVRTILVKSKNKLYEYEEKMGFLKKQEKINKLLIKLEEQNITEETKKIIQEIKEDIDL